MEVKKILHSIRFSAAFENYFRYEYSLYSCSMDRTNRDPDAVVKLHQVRYEHRTIFPEVSSDFSDSRVIQLLERQ